jgi:diketogulonate reductase-like aldo/keto reductase
VLSKGFLVIVGIRNAEQAEENLGASGWSLSTEEVESISFSNDIFHSYFAYTLYFSAIDRIACKTPQFIKNPQECL